jgi:mRNA interferase RelE/StbE
MGEKNWTVELSKDTLKYLKKLSRNTAQRILDSLERLESTKNPAFHKDVKPLTGKLKGYYRLRVGDYRLILELDNDNRRIGILVIVPRGDAY